MTLLACMDEIPFGSVKGPYCSRAALPVRGSPVYACAQDKARSRRSSKEARMTRRPLSLSLILAIVSAVLVTAPAALATPVCTDGYEGGPPRSDCGGRVFPESADTTEYVQYQPDPITGFREYQHGIEYLAQL